MNNPCLRIRMTKRIQNQSVSRQSRPCKPQFASKTISSHLSSICWIGKSVARPLFGRFTGLDRADVWCLPRWGKSAAKRPNLDWETVKSGVLTRCDWRRSKQYNQLYKVVAPIGQSGSVSYFIIVFHPWTNLESTNPSDQPNHTDFLLLTSSLKINVSFRISLWWLILEF
jgi:hypothetical protein